MGSTGITLRDDETGYPTEEFLEAVKNWPHSDSTGLMDEIKRAWMYSHYFRRRGRTYRLSTGGWSGNESIIAAMQSNQIFWGFCWVQSKRGGHYIFEVPEGW